MAYRMIHHKPNGDVEMKRVDGKSESTFVRKWEGTRGVIVKDSTKRQVAYNLTGGSKQKREAQIKKHLERTRKAYVDTKGFSKGKTMKHVASIPAEYWWSEKGERGPEALRDPKELMKFARDWDCMVSKP